LQINITYIIPNVGPPTFQNTIDIPDVFVNINEVKSLALPNIVDPDADDTGSCIVNFGLAS